MVAAASTCLQICLRGGEGSFFCSMSSKDWCAFLVIGGVSVSIANNYRGGAVKVSMSGNVNGNEWRPEQGKMMTNQSHPPLVRVLRKMVP